MKRKTTFLAAAAALLVATTDLAAEDLTPLLAEAVRTELPSALAAAAPAGALAYSGPEGGFRVEVGEMNAAAPAEAVFLLEGSAPVFLADTGAKVFRKSVKLPIRTESVTAVYHAFAEGRSLAQLSANGGAASVLVSWDGKKLEVIWESGKQRAGESRWFELDDLDHDGVREVITYQRAELDIDTDDEIGETSTGTSAESLGPTSVLRWTEGKWREDRAALNTLR